MSVLLVGTGLTSGWGVATHQLALTGLLRDELQRRSSREVCVELVGDELLDVQTAATWIGDRAGDGWDAVVIAIGANDAARLTPLSIWETAYRALVRKVRAEMAPDAPLVLVGLPPMSSIVPLRGPMTRVVSSHAQRMNEVVHRIAHQTDGVVAVALPAKATEADRPWGSAAAYLPWAEAIAPAILESVLESTAVRQRRDRTPPPQVASLLDAAYGAGNRTLQALVDDAATRLGVASARVKLLDGDRVYVAADSARGASKALPRSLTFCDVTVREGELEVRDVDADDRFNRNPMLRLAGATSYAGVAVNGPDGAPIGTVCVFNGSAATGVDMDALRALAKRVEAELENPASTAAPDEQDGEGAHPARSGGPLAKVLGAAHLRLRGARFSREARAGRTAPADSGAVLRIGRDPIRVLVYGGEYAVGFGAATRDDALDGAVADLLHEHTGRGVIVHNRSDERWHLHELAERLGSTGAHLYDLVVWAPHYAEAARHSTLLPWRSGVTRMLMRIRDTSDAGTVLLGIPMLLGPQPLAVVARWRARQIEQVLRQISERTPKTLVVPAPPVAMKELESTSGPAVYAGAAAAALPAMLELLGVRHLTRATADPVRTGSPLVLR